MIWDGEESKWSVDVTPHVRKSCTRDVGQERRWCLFAGSLRLYYWDERDGVAFSGWWFGPKIGGDQASDGLQGFPYGCLLKAL